jgi:acyl carrier protein
MSNSTEKNDIEIERIATELRGFILNDLGRVGIEKLSSEDNLFQSGVLDSMGTLEVITFCEEKYNITFDLSSISEETFSSLEKLARSVQGYIDSKI